MEECLEDDLVERLALDRRDLLFKRGWLAGAVAAREGAGAPWGTPMDSVQDKRYLSVLKIDDKSLASLLGTKGDLGRH
ncbi:hypothetical protein V1504DRAFT_455823 [Lipomyces starkeyi]